MESKQSVFNTLYEIDTRGRSVEKDTGRQKLDYLPWAVTYSEVAKNFDIEYGFVTHDEEKTVTVTRDAADGSTITETVKYTQKIPYTETPSGLIVETWVSINGVKKSMMLPVYDSSFKSMKLEPYTYETKSGTKTVPGATIADVYKSIMRCFAKNLSMWGVGLNFWTKEDAPESVLKAEKLINEIDVVYATKKKKGFTDEELLKIMTDVLPEDLNGNWHLCKDEETLETAKKKLLTTIKKKG